MIRSFLLLLMAEDKVSPLLILSTRDLVWFCCDSSDSRRFKELPNSRMCTGQQ